MKFVKEDMKNFRERFAFWAGPLCEELDINIELGRITFMDDSFTCKMKVVKREAINKVCENGIPEKFASVALEYTKNVHKHGLSKDLLGKRFKDVDGVGYQLVGYKASARKYPLVVEREDGSVRKATVAWVVLRMGRDGVQVS